MEKRKSNKSLEELYTEELMQDPYKDVTLSDIGEAADSEAMGRAVSKQRKQKAYFERLKQKLDRGM
jgi:hypothetical protein